MDPLTPLSSLEFFERHLPDFLKQDAGIENLIAKLKASLEAPESDSLYANQLVAGKDFLKHILGLSIKYLSDTASQPVPSNRAVKNIREFVDTFAIFEELLFGLNTSYRDHTLHSVWVYLFGHEWIHKTIGYRHIKLSGQMSVVHSKLGVSFSTRPEKIVTANLKHLQAIWVLIALLHDLGYPVQTITNKPNEVFGRILEPFGIDFLASFNADLGARISFIHQPLCDLLATVYRPRVLNEDEEKRYYEEAKKENRPVIGVKPIIDKDEALEMEFRIATANKIHSAWSAILAFKNIDYLHMSDYRGGGDIDYLKLLTRRDILESIVHHTSEEPKDLAVNRFQFILLLMDDIEEAFRYGRGGLARGNILTECKLKWEVNQDQTKLLLDYKDYEAEHGPKVKEKYEEISKKYKTQIATEIDGEKYVIEIQFIGQEFEESLKLTLVKDPPLTMTR